MANQRSALAQDLPKAFQVDRYAALWERNPFAPLARTLPLAPVNPFSGWYLVSWSREGDQTTVVAANSESNRTHVIGYGPNPEHLRLFKLKISSDPHLVEALVGNDQDKGTLLFRASIKNTAFVGTPAGTQANALQPLLVPDSVDSINPTIEASAASATPPPAMRAPRIHKEGGRTQARLSGSMNTPQAGNHN